jgi:hypothetical protein
LEQFVVRKLALVKDVRRRMAAQSLEISFWTGCSVSAMLLALASGEEAVFEKKTATRPSGTQRM